VGASWVCAKLLGHPQAAAKQPHLIIGSRPSLDTQSFVFLLGIVLCCIFCLLCGVSILQALDILLEEFSALSLSRLEHLIHLIVPVGSETESRSWNICNPIFPAGGLWEVLVDAIDNNSDSNLGIFEDLRNFRLLHIFEYAYDRSYDRSYAIDSFARIFNLRFIH
jgi:hypothetical protein